MNTFATINKAYAHVFQPERLTVGVVVPIENHGLSAIPTLEQHLERVQLVEQLGFKAIWLRDIPLHVPAFGDAGQTFDPFTYLGYLAAQTSQIALGIASIALPLHHPIHVAKAAASVDQLSGGRLILGVASGDRPEEYPAMGITYSQRGDLFREAFSYIRQAQEGFPNLSTEHYGNLNGQADILPKATAHKIPMLVTGHSRQSVDWISEHSDGWMYYPRNPLMQKQIIAEWRQMVAKHHKPDQPFMQSLYIDLHEDDNFLPQPIHLGFRIGANRLVEYFNNLERIGVNHVALNLRFNTLAIEQTLEHLATKVLAHFH